MCFLPAVTQTVEVFGESKTTTYSLFDVAFGKTLSEGAVGGVVGSVVICGLFGYLVMPENLVLCLLIGLFGSIVAQLGDLSASAFKRQMGIKDYGNLIPGHGGILDRFDSVFFTAPMVFYVPLVVMILGNIISYYAG
mgnify:CR=1 FL=1